MQSQRVKYFDMMKGVAIFFVVMGHVIAMCIREIDRTPLFKFLENIHMPLFFFISGWFTYKMRDGRLAIPSPGKKFVRLIVPMAVVSTLWIFYFPHSGLESPFNSTFEGLWSDTWKNGYWFTLVLFEIFLIYMVLGRLLNRAESLVASVSLVLAAWVALICLDMLCPANVSGWLSLNLTAAYFPAFMTGWLGRKFKDRFMKAVHSSGCQTAAVAIFALTLYISSWPWEFALTELGEILVGTMLHITLALIAMGIFERWESAAYRSGASAVATWMADFWAYIGTQSLGIYLLHYFFLFPMGGIFRPTLEAMNLAFVPMLVFTGFWALCIVGTVLLVIRIIDVSKLLSLLLTGGDGK